MVELENPGWLHIQTAFYSFLKEYPHIQCFPSDKKLQYVAALSSRKESVFSDGRLRIENAGKQKNAWARLSVCGSAKYY